MISTAKRDRLKKKCIARDGLNCYYCGWQPKVEDATLDHVVPLAEGGKWELDNLVIACSTCNHQKSNLPVELFRLYRWLTRGRKNWRLRVVRWVACLAARPVTRLRFPGEKRNEQRGEVFA